MIENAIVGSIFVGLEGHGIPTIMVDLDFGSHQGFGGYDLRYKDTAATFIKGLCRVTECDDLSEMNGKVVRIERGGGMIQRIGHPVRDIWFGREDMPS